MKTTGFRPTQIVQSILDEKKSEGVNISEYLNKAVVYYEDAKFNDRWRAVETVYDAHDGEEHGVRNFRPISMLSLGSVKRFDMALERNGLQKFVYHVGSGVMYTIYAVSKEVADMELLRYFNVDGDKMTRTNHPLPKALFDVGTEHIMIVTYEPIQEDKG